jgi:hypothetical protein
MEFGRPSNGHLQHHLPTRHANVHDIYSAVNLYDIIAHSSNAQMTSGKYEHGEASKYPFDDLIAHMAGQEIVYLAPAGDIRHVLASQQRPVGDNATTSKHMRPPILLPR